MSRWFRHYAGMCRDDKLVRASLRSKQSIERVVWVWSAVLESAAELDDEGRYEVDVAEISHFLRCKPAHPEAILSALIELGRIDGARVTAWSKRQFKSDRSNDRVALHRAKSKQRGSSEVTLPERDRNSPETETETDTDYSVANATGAAAPKRDADTIFWANAKAYLQPHVKGDPGALVGKWARDHGKDAAAQAITAAQLERPASPVAFIEGRFRRIASNEDQGFSIGGTRMSSPC